MYSHCRYSHSSVFLFYQQCFLHLLFFFCFLLHSVSQCFKWGFFSTGCHHACINTHGLAGVFSAFQEFSQISHPHPHSHPFPLWFLFSFHNSIKALLLLDLYVKNLHMVLVQTKIQSDDPEQSNTPKYRRAA